MEGVAFSLRDGYECLRAVSVSSIADVRATGGGARHPLWRQILADILGIPIRALAIDEGAAYGAALLAGVASGIYASVEEACSLVRMQDDVTFPDPERHERYGELFTLYRSLYEPLRSVSWKLAELRDALLPGTGGKSLELEEFTGEGSDLSPSKPIF